MALVRVYCGISSAADAGTVSASTKLTVAVVDDSGRLLEYCEINDDPGGYAALTAFLAERFGGSTAITVAVDNDEYLAVSLLIASGRPVAFTDEETADDFAERFADDNSLEEVNAADAERRAVGLARALQAGALSAAVTAAPREYAVLKPLLAAHSALAVGRHATAVALREVLRELYPAALRAYPDPAAPVALAMLDALPEPGLLTAAAGRGRDAAVTVAARLVADGVCDNDTALEAVTALRVAITETPRRNGVGKQLTTAVAEAVRSSVAAVRSADSAANILIHALSERVSPNTASAPATTARRRTPPTPITTAVAQPRPVAPPPQAPTPVSAAPAVPVPVSPAPVTVDATANAAATSTAATSPAAQPAARPAWAQSTPPPTPPGFEPTPVTGSPLVPEPAAAQRSAPPAQRTAPPAERSAPPITERSAPPLERITAKEPLTPFVPILTNAAINSERAARRLTPPPAPTAPAAPPAAPPVAAPVSASPVDPRPVSASPASRQPVSASPVDPRPVSASSADPRPVSASSADPRPVSASPADPLPSRADWPLVNEESTPPKRVTPPWQADDLVLPSLRLVEPTPPPASAPPAPAPLRLVGDPLSGPSPLDQVAPHQDAAGPGRIPKPRRVERAAPPTGDDDTDLLIFASVSSAWFTGEEGGEENTWNSAMDVGWRAAEEASLRPSVAADTRAGLPQRVPAANLVPGSPISQERPLRVVRDAGEIAAHTSSYFRGWRRGTQETGGYPVGGRPGRESATGWDFSRDHEIRDDEYSHRAANYR